jgi:hypothetical protein
MSNDTTMSMAGSPVTWFEIGTDDAGAARDFYDALLGWTFAVDGPYSIITTGTDHVLQGGIQDTSGPVPDGTPRTYAIPYVQVADVAATCARVGELGGKVLVPATMTPFGLTYAHIADPADNHIGLWTPPAS